MAAFVPLALASGTMFGVIRDSIPNAAFLFRVDSPALQVIVDPHSGSYEVTARGGMAWRGLDYSLSANGTVFSASNGTLRLQGPGTMSNGTDGIGAYESISLRWETAARTGRLVGPSTGTRVRSTVETSTTPVGGVAWLFCGCVRPSVFR